MLNESSKVERACFGLEVTTAATTKPKKKERTLNVSSMALVFRRCIQGLKVDFIQTDILLEEDEDYIVG